MEKNRRKMGCITRGTVMIDGSGYKEKVEAKRLPVPDGKISWYHSVTSSSDTDSCSASRNQAFVCVS